MPDVSDPESPKRVEFEPLIVPKAALQLFGAYLRQEFKEPLEIIGKPHNQRLVDFIDNLETSKEVKLVTKDIIMDFEFSKEKDHVLPANSFTMNNDLTFHFLTAIDHNARNAINLLVRVNEKMSIKMAGTLTALSNARGLEMSRDENGKVKIVPLSHPTA